MTGDFFDEKRPWSCFKDCILESYLWPYLEKIKFLRKPIVVLDCCAGPGRYRKSGESGSPLVIAERLKAFSEKYVQPRSLGVYIEKNRAYFNELKKNLKPFGRQAVCLHSEYQDYLGEIAELTEKASVFLYIDPFGPAGLYFDELEKVFAGVAKGRSVEVLLNFDADGIVRWGLKALAQGGDSLPDDTCAEMNKESLDNYSSDIQELDRVMGGEEWKDTLTSSGGLEKKQAAVCELYVAKLNRHFKHVIALPIRGKLVRIPKYHMVFGTRHRDGLFLMNDSMAKARVAALDQEFATDVLFDTTPLDERADLKVLADQIFRVVQANPGLLRSDVYELVLCSGEAEVFARYTRSDLNKAFGCLLRETRAIRKVLPGEKIDSARIYPA